MPLWTDHQNTDKRQSGDLRLILAVGGVTVPALLWGLTRPLWIGRNPHPIIDWEPLATMIGISPAGFARFAVTLVVWFGAYAMALAVSRRRLGRGPRWALVLVPVLFALTLVPTLPGASKDMYHYIMEGRVWALHGHNPLTTAPERVPEDPLYWILSSWEFEPSRYGPLWALIASVPARVAGDSLIGSVLVFKAIMLAAFALTAWLVYLTVRRTRPAWALAAFVFVAWNPLLLFESAANGHNDTLMLAFTALALYLASRRHWAGVFPALAAAALIKYVTGLLGPLLLVWAWRSSRSAEERWRIVLGLILGLALTVVMYVPFWEGMHTFHALRGAAGDALNSPGWLLREGLRRAGVSDWTGQLWVSVTLTVLFIVAYVVALRMAWRAGGQALTPRPPRPMLGEGENTSITVDQSSLHSLLGAGEPRSTSVEQDSPLPVLGEGPGVRAVQAGFFALAAYICTLAWWFWPWYVSWLVPIGALLVGGREARLTAVWSCAALAAYIPINYRVLFWGEVPDRHMPFFAALTVFGVALVMAVWLYARPQLLSMGRWLRARTLSPGPGVQGPASGEGETRHRTSDTAHRTPAADADVPSTTT